MKMIVISGEFLKSLAECPGTNDISFFSLDEGDVYSTLIKTRRPVDSVPGTVYIRSDTENVQFTAIGKATDKVRVIVDASSKVSCDSSVLHSVKATGFVRSEFGWIESPVQIVPVRGEMFSRLHGIIETYVLSGKKVFTAGLGSGGSTIAVELAKSGVDHFFLMDHDQIEIGNVARHEAGLSDVGRFKTKVVAERIHEKNPCAEIEMWEEKVSSENAELVQEIVRKVDIVICATDSRPSKLLLNRLCVEENKPCIFAGVFRRAYGGQIQVVRSRVSPCYQCFLMLLPEQDQDQEVSSREQANNLSYTDRPVAVEPGLANDIAPISTMVVKLVIQELLKGTETTLASLNQDLVAPLFWWLNRRESGTQYEKLKPLEYNISGMHILRWYGIAIERVPECPVCGEGGDLLLQTLGNVL
jgi:molybdopterin/thiamine biosynthesis adenylyltransferase